MKPVGYLGILLTRGVQFGHPAGERLLLVFQRAKAGEYRHALRKNGAAGKRKAFLRKVAEGDTLLSGNGTGIEALDTCQDLEQGGLAGAIGSHDAGPLVRRNQPIDILEKNSGAVALSRPGELDHEE